MRFNADLHIHSKYSRATSKDCDLEHLTYWGRKKGIAVIGTGDFTHPAWFAEIKEKLVPAEPGLFQLRPDLEKQISQKLPPACRGTTRFMLSVEISTIYKKGGKTRKVHHLVYAPSLEKAGKINRRLERIGNIRSDGRPILGLDSRHLLEIVLEAGRDCYMVPAHIWTPWFSVLGSKSGFDRVADCYGDLADHIFAVETGLSSDPEMNWRVSGLDRYRLVSNSDVHSPAKLGREISVFDTDLDYYAICEALKTGKGCGGTLEFFPEEGKYHLDGHRKCGVRLAPEESRAHQGICPVCKKPLTLGVMYRVEELADRKEKQKPKDAADFKNVIPLPEILSEILGLGPAAQSVCREWEGLISKLGPELGILNEASIDQISRASSGLLAEAISRMREGKVLRNAGYDGEYGRIKLFTDEELKERLQSGVLFDVKLASSTTSLRAGGEAISDLSMRLPRRPFGPPHNDKGENHPVSFFNLDSEQQKALEILEGPLLIVAGPGSGKTRTLTARIAHLILQGRAKEEECLTLTFTRRAAEEMRQRLALLLRDKYKNIPILTFHGLGLKILEENGQKLGLPRGFQVASEPARRALLAAALKYTELKARKYLQEISRLKCKGLSPEPGGRLAGAWSVLEEKRRGEGLLDFDDLILYPLQLFEDDPAAKSLYQNRFRWISIDEYQDIDPLQYRLIRHLVPEDGNLCAIGDPDQAIYSFRGASVEFFLRFQEDFPRAKQIRLVRNYRSGESILTASHQMIRPASLVEDRGLGAFLEDTGKVVIHEAPTAKAEAEFVVHTIEKMVGGISFFSLDSDRSDGSGDAPRSFSDFAVLYRTEAQAELLETALVRSGIPFQRHNHEDIDLWDERAERVSLLTLHAVKGLEFSVVFITGCEEGILPLSFGGPLSKEGPAEERRLFYVGMTRAKEKLFLSYARKRFWHGKPREQSPSTFLKDIEEKLLERSKAAFAKKAAKSPQLDLF